MRQHPWRVLFVDHETRLSGGERDLVDLVRGFPPASVDVHVALPQRGQLSEALEGLGATVHLVPMAKGLRRFSRWELASAPWRSVPHVGSALGWAARLVLLARRLQPDVVHTNSMKAHLLALPAARASGSSLVWHVRDIIEATWLGRAFVFGAGLLPDRVICLSRAAARPFATGRSSKRTRVVYNGIRLSPIDELLVGAWRARLGAGNGQPLVGIVGQLARWKGQDLFLDAAAKLAAERPDVRFAVIGACLFPENERAYADGLRAQARALGLGARLTWLEQADPIEPVMAALDVLVHASRLPEPFGRVIVEALAAGTPVVASTRGAGPELVTGSAGRVADPEDPAALAQAIAEFLDVGHGELGATAKEAAARFDISATASGVLSVYEELA